MSVCRILNITYLNIISIYSNGRVRRLHGLMAEIELPVTLSLMLHFKG